MSRVAKKPIELPKGVDININGQTVKVKGPKGEMTWELHKNVNIAEEGRVISFSPKDDSIETNALAGTSRALINNMVIGVDKGFQKTLLLVGVGYRAVVEGSKINLSLGFSHPVNYAMPEGVTVTMPNNTTIVLSSTNKQLLGQVASEIRAFRPPEPYKGKGIRYADETILRKETKKK